MAGFESLAKGLLKEVAPKGDTLQQDLENAGFSRADILQDLRSLADSTDNDNVKKGVLELATKLHGLLKDDTVVKTAPTIILNIQGGNVSRETTNGKLNAMLNPALCIHEVIN